MCQFRNTASGYGLVSRLLHGVLALTVIVMLSIGFFLDDIQDKALKLQLVGLHKSTGLLVILIALIFIIWSLLNQKPAYPTDMPTWERKLARSVHHLLYLVVLAMPLSGWIMSTAAGKTPTFYGMFELPFPGIPLSKTISSNGFEMHEYLAWTLLALICLHLLGALKHHFIDKNDILRRMFSSR